MTSQRKLDMVGTHSTVRKQAKRMPDTIVETTGLLCEEAYCCTTLPAFFDVALNQVKASDQTKLLW